MALVTWLTWRRWLLITLVWWAVASALTIVEARSSAIEARSELAAELAVDDLASIDLDSSASTLQDAELGLAEARGHLESLVLMPLRPVPFVGRQLESARVLTATSEVLARQSATAVEKAQLARSDQAEAGRVGAVGELEIALVALSETARSADLGPSTGLVGPLVNARVELADSLKKAAPLLEDAASAVGGAAEMIEDSKYLVLITNNAEMRLASGMPLSIGRLHIVDGLVESFDVWPANGLQPVLGVPAVDEDIESRWGFLSPTNDYRKLTYSARFAEYSGPQALKMWEIQRGENLDGVILIDPFVLATLMRTTGPVEVNDLTITADEALEYFLVGQYQRYGDYSDDVQDVRRESQALAATSIMAGLADGNLDAFALLKDLRSLVGGRHLLLYSPHSKQQTAFAAMGATGELKGDEVGAYLLNLIASKSDPFVNVEVEPTFEHGATETLVSLHISITNNTPDTATDFQVGLAQYTNLGSTEVLELEDYLGRQDYLGRLAVYAPAFAREVQFTSDESLEVFGPDGQVWVIATRVRIAQGETIQRTVTFTVPADRLTMSVLPSSRYPGTLWTVEGDARLDDGPIEISLSGG